MASISLYLDTRYRRPDGKYTIKIKVSLRNKRGFLINTTLRVEASQWDKARGKVINHPRKNEYNSRIAYKVTQVEMAVLDLEQSGEIYRLQPADIKLKVEDKMGRVSSPDNSFMDYLSRMIENAASTNTKLSYQYAFNQIHDFVDGRPVRFEDVNYNWLSNFQKYLSEKKIAVNSQWLIFSKIKSTYNAAITAEKVDANLYPFRKFKFKQEPTRKRSLTIEDMRLIRDWPCSGAKEESRDLFMLIFYLAGINIVDLSRLTEVTKTGYVEYKRTKTGKLYTIKVYPEAQQLIDKYKTDNLLIGKLCPNSYKVLTKKCNEHLKKTFVVDGKPLFPDISTYWARHTFATIAAELDIPKETIAATLGHGGNDVTDIYIKFDQRKIDDCIGRVIEAVRG